MADFFHKVQSFVRGDNAKSTSNGASSDTPPSSPSSLGASILPTQFPSTAQEAQPMQEAIAKPETLPPEAFSRTNGHPSETPLPTAPANRPLYKSWLAWTLMTMLAGAGGLAGASIHAIRQIQATLPEPEDALIFVRDGTLTIKASDGSILQQLGPATRASLSVDDMPPEIAEAFVASEDRYFYEHGGVDYRAILRAALANVTAGEVVEGASTITQQVARIVFLDQDQTLERKLREALLAHKMEQELTKDQILERYINLVYLGGGAYGVADAAWVYFSKSVDELTLPEVAMVVGLAPAPSQFSPLVNEEAAVGRRNLVLSRMQEAGFITAQERAEAEAAPLELKPQTPRNLYSRFPYFTQYVQQQLPKLIDPAEIERGGLTVETTLNPQWQDIAQKTVNEAIANYGRGQRFSQAAMVAIDPRNGQIKAMVGGNDFNESQFNRVVQAQRQPGSTFKPFVYTTAIAAGFSPYKTYLDAKLVVDGYEPKNYSKTYSGNQTMRDALVRSVNIIAVKVLIDVGFDPVIQMAERMGIHSKLIPAYSLALGSVEVNLLELTGAYGTLANRGKHVEPHGITRILDRKGKVIYEAKFAAEQAVDQDTADIMTWMLRGVVTSGTGGNASLSDRPVAGKTGTSEQRRDLWFIGYIPQMVTGVWLGNDDNSPTQGASSTAARVWNNFMRQIISAIPVQQFPELPRLTGREATIKTQKVKPKKVQATKTDEESESNHHRSEPRRTRQQEPSRPSPAPERHSDPPSSPNPTATSSPSRFTPSFQQESPPVESVDPPPSPQPPVESPDVPVAPPDPPSPPVESAPSPPQAETPPPPSPQASVPPE